MREKINVYDSIDSLCEGFTALLKRELSKKEEVNISLSGGSTPKALFEYWSANCQDDVDWQRVTFYWGDERCVPPDDSMSNFGMTKELLFDKIPAIGSTQIHRIHGENDPSEEVVWYNDIMDKFLPKTDDGVPVFDIMMLGMGDDGHTVSIFPDQIELWNEPANCVIASHPETGMKRISLTGRVVNNARNIAFLVTGETKAEKAKQVITDQCAYVDKYPAAKVNPVNGNLYWYLDKAAAALL